MKKQMTDQVPLAASRCNARIPAIRGKLSRGPNEHHPIGSLPLRARTAYTFPVSTRCLKSRRFLSPLLASQLFPCLGTRHDMHQQPPQAPFRPKSSSMTLQSRVVMGRMVQFPGGAASLALPRDPAIVVLRATPSALNRCSSEAPAACSLTAIEPIIAAPLSVNTTMNEADFRVEPGRTLATIASVRNMRARRLGHFTGPDCRRRDGRSPMSSAPRLRRSSLRVFHSQIENPAAPTGMSQPRGGAP